MDRPGQDAARNAATVEMAARGWETIDLARAAGIDPGTAGDFLNGTRWPRLTSLSKIETAFGWDLGKLTRLAAGSDVSPNAHDDVLLDLPKSAIKGLTDEGIEELKMKLRGQAYDIAAQIRERIDKESNE